MAEYEAFFPGDTYPEDGCVVVLDVKDRETFETKAVKARLSRNREQLNSAEPLLLGLTGNFGVAKELYWVEVLEEMPEEQPQEVTVRKMSIPMTERRGFMVRSIIEEKSADKKEGGT